MTNYYINCYHKNRNLKSLFKFDIESYDFVLEHSSNINILQSLNVPITADLNDNQIVIAQQDGFFKVLKSNDLKLIYSLKAHNSTINDLKIRPNQPHHVLTCSSDSNLFLWDIETKQKLITFDHSNTIKSLDFKNEFCFASGTRNGKILLHDTRSKEPIQRVDNAHQLNKIITGVVFNYLNYLYSCCSSDNFIKIWDFRFNKTSKSSPNHLVHVGKVKYSGSSNRVEGFTNLTLDDKLNLYASCTDSKLYSYDYPTLNGSKRNSVKCFDGASITRFSKIKVLNGLDLLVSGSSDAEAVLWSLNKPKEESINYPMLVLPHLLEEVSIVLCENSKYEIITCDDSNNVYKWMMNSKLNKNNKKFKYRKGRISEKFKVKNVFKPIDLNNVTKTRKRFLSSGYNGELLHSDEQENLRRPFKRSRSVIEKL